MFTSGLIVRLTALYSTSVALVVIFIAAAGASAWSLAAAGVVGVVMDAALTFLLLSGAARQLRKIGDTADSFAAGRFDARVETSDDEFRGLANALNDAGQRIETVVGELRRAQTQLEALLNASGDATIAIDRAGSVVYVNNAALHLFSATDGFGHSYIEVVRDHELNELMAAAVGRGESSVRVVPYGAAQRWLQVTSVPIEGGGTWAALAVFHDLTEVRRLDSMRRDFVSNVSHELKTPLAGIRAAAETLQEGALDERPTAEEFVGHIVRETDRLTQLVEELLELSRIESGAAPLHLEPFDAATLVQHVVVRFAQQAERAGLRISCRAEAGDVQPVGDVERLDRALGNLIANAIKFTPRGGEVVVSAKSEDCDVLFSVRDTGVGIELADQERVFERFYKSDRSRGGSGVGLGLAIVKHIARAHGGTVSVQSRPGRGATFTITLPAGRSLTETTDRRRA